MYCCRGPRGIHTPDLVALPCGNECDRKEREIPAVTSYLAIASGLSNSTHSRCAVAAVTAREAWAASGTGAQEDGESDMERLRQGVSVGGAYHSREQGERVVSAMGTNPTGAVGPVGKRLHPG